LKPKSKNSALLYSAVLPGSGQYYSGSKTKGIVIGALVLGSSAAGIVSYLDYLDNRDLYVQDKADYENNTDLAQMQSLRSKMSKSYKSAEDAQKTSQILLGVTAALWIYNIIDSYLFFPDQSGIKISENNNKDTFGMSLNMKF